MLEAKQYARAYSTCGFGELNEDDQYIINFSTTENFNYDYKHLIQEVGGEYLSNP